tara:strand:- start:632 stop:751 length:120 start_codon:yes stop_codon:yes gene_type:complete
MPGGKGTYGRMKGRPPTMTPEQKKKMMAMMKKKKKMKRA